MFTYFRYNKKTYRIDGIDWTLNPDSIFDCGGSNKPYYSYYQVTTFSHARFFRNNLRFSSYYNKQKCRGFSKIVKVYIFSRQHFLISPIFKLSKVVLPQGIWARFHEFEIGCSLQPFLFKQSKKEKRYQK